MADTLSEKLYRVLASHDNGTEQRCCCFVCQAVREAAAELDRRDELALRYEAWVRAMHGPTSVPPVVDRSIEEAEQALLALIPVED